MTDGILAASYSNFTTNQDEFEIKDEIEEKKDNKIYRVKNYVQTKTNCNFSKSHCVIASCAVMCTITIIIIAIISNRHSYAKVDETLTHKIPSRINDTEDKQLLKKPDPVEIKTDLKYNQITVTNDSSKESPYYFLPQLLLSDNNNIWIFDSKNKSSRLFYEAKSIIDAFGVFTLENIFFSSRDNGFPTIHSLSNPEYKSSEHFFENIFEEARFTSQGIAFDYTTDNVYAVDEDKGVLIVLNLHTKLFTLLLTDLIQPRNIYVDPLEGIMFILQVSHSILKGGMDGRNLNNIIARTGISAMTLDIINKRVYWVNDFVGIESSNYNGEYISQFPTDTSTIIDLAIVDSKLFWIWQNHHYPTTHHLLYCKINGGYCENHEMHLLKNLHNVSSIKSIYERKETSSKLISNSCKVNNGGCEHLCLSTFNASYSCACKLGWQVKPDKRTCHETFNFILYATKSMIRSHVLDVTGTTSTDVIFPTSYYVDKVNDFFVFDYDHLNDNFYFSDGNKIYKRKLKSYKDQQQVILHSNDRILDMAYDYAEKTMYTYEYESSYSSDCKDYLIKVFRIVDNEMISNNRYALSCAYASDVRNHGINFYFKKLSYFMMKKDNNMYEKPKIERYFYDSSSLPAMSITISSDILSLKRPVAIDYQENKLYWIDSSPTIVIKCATFDGNITKEIIVDEIENAHYIFVYHQWIYLADQETVWRIYKNTGKGAIKVVSNPGFISDMRLISNHTV